MRITKSMLTDPITSIFPFAKNDIVSLLSANMYVHGRLPILSNCENKALLAAYKFWYIFNSSA